MTQIHISAKSYDLLAVASIENPIIGETVTRRVNRVATLDGGAAFNENGFSHADRDLSIRWTPSSLAQINAVQRMTELHQRVIVSMRSGCFEAAIQTFEPSDEECRLDLLIASKLG